MAKAPPPVLNPTGEPAGVVVITYGLHSHVALSDNTGNRLKTGNVQLVSAVLSITIDGVVYPPLSFSGTVAIASSNGSLGVLRLQSITQNALIKKRKPLDATATGTLAVSIYDPTTATTTTVSPFPVIYVDDGLAC